MKDFFRKKTWLITSSMLVIAFSLSLALVYFEFGFEQNIKITNAGSEHNISGWAWNDHIGWISFNSNDCDKNGNGYVDTSVITNSCNGNDDATTPVKNYGVSIDPATGDLSGHAWNDKIGWISFDRSETGAPPRQPYLNGTILANYNRGNNQIDGWAKILILGDDGWIKLRKFASDDGVDYGTSVNPATGELVGWAWNANNDTGAGIGWVSFNCLNESPQCSGTNYKVTAGVNNAPTVANLTAPNWNYLQAAGNAKHANLQFDFVDTDSGSSGSKYQLIVRRSSDDQEVLNTGECTGYIAAPSKCKVDIDCMEALDPSNGCVNAGDCVCTYPLDATELDYGAAYKWSVQVWDNSGVASAVTSYNTTPDTDNDDGVAATFTTYKHKFPLPSATYFPLKPSKGEAVKFTDTSKTFLAGGYPADEVPCDPSLCTWEWTIPTDATIDDKATSTPTIIFNSAGDNDVRLKVTDKIDGYYSEATITLKANAKLPKWQEVRPE